jgi:UPF0148 protein
MSKELAKKAVEMLLNGATLVSDPCPYCKGVRVIKDGSALCVSCGKEGINENTPSNQDTLQKDQSAMGNLDQKLKDLTEDLQREKDYEKQQQILRSINEIIVIREKLRKI